MKTRTQILAILVLGLVSLSTPLSRTRADVLNDWMKTSDTHIRANRTLALEGSGKMTMVQVAMFDAINAVIGGYTPYALDIVAPGASAEAATAQAAYTVLTNFSRNGISTLNSALATTLSNVPDGPAKEAGIQIGRLAGEAIIRLRAGDNPHLEIPDAPGNLPGQWRRTPPNYLSAGFTRERYLPSWTTRSSSQFRPPPPPALTSALYAADYNEVRSLGSIANPNRTPEQTDTVQLQDAENWVADVYHQHPLSLLEAARREALMWMAYMDTMSHLSDALFTYNFWRPITAIQQGANDGNDATPGDPAWTPLLNSHPYPDYPAGRVALLAIDVEMLILLHGDDFSFTATSPGKTRTFARLSDYVQDTIDARVLAGTHFRNSGHAAVEMTRQIARHAFQNYLRPVPRLRSGPVQPGEFTLFLEQPALAAYRIEFSNDFQQWQPWQANVLGTISLTDTNTPTDQRFYRLVLGQP